MIYRMDQIQTRVPGAAGGTVMVRLWVIFIGRNRMQEEATGNYTVKNSSKRIFPSMPFQEASNCQEGAGEEHRLHY